MESHRLNAVCELGMRENTKLFKEAVFLLGTITFICCPERLSGSQFKMRTFKLDGSRC